MDDGTFYVMLGVISLGIVLLYVDIARIENKRRAERLQRGKRRYERVD